MIDLDEIDRALVQALARDANQSAGALGRRLGLSQPATWRRIRKLEEAGVLKGRRLRLNAEKLGFGVTVFLGVKLATKAVSVWKILNAQSAQSLRSNGLSMCWACLITVYAWSLAISLILNVSCDGAS